MSVDLEAPSVETAASLQFLISHPERGSITLITQSHYIRRDWIQSCKKRTKVGVLGDLLLASLANGKQRVYLQLHVEVSSIILGTGDRVSELFRQSEMNILSSPVTDSFDKGMPSMVSQISTKDAIDKEEGGIDIKEAETINSDSEDKRLVEGGGGEEEEEGGGGGGEVEVIEDDIVVVVVAEDDDEVENDEEGEATREELERREDDVIVIVEERRETLFEEDRKEGGVRSEEQEEEEKEEEEGEGIVGEIMREIVGEVQEDKRKEDNEDVDVEMDEEELVLGKRDIDISVLDKEGEVEIGGEGEGEDEELVMGGREDKGVEGMGGEEKREAAEEEEVIMKGEKEEIEWKEEEEGKDEVGAVIRGSEEGVIEEGVLVAVAVVEEKGEGKGGLDGGNDGGNGVGIEEEVGGSEGGGGGEEGRRREVEEDIDVVILDGHQEVTEH